MHFVQVQYSIEKWVWHGLKVASFCFCIVQKKITYLKNPMRVSLYSRIGVRRCQQIARNICKQIDLVLRILIIVFCFVFLAFKIIGILCTKNT